MTHKNRADGYSCSLDVLNGGLGKVICNFWSEKDFFFNSAVQYLFFPSIFGHQNPRSGLDPDSLDIEIQQKSGSSLDSMIDWIRKNTKKCKKNSRLNQTIPGHGESLSKPPLCQKESHLLTNDAQTSCQQLSIGPCNPHQTIRNAVFSYHVATLRHWSPRRLFAGLFRRNLSAEERAGSHAAACGTAGVAAGVTAEVAAVAVTSSGHQLTGQHRCRCNERSCCTTRSRAG